MEMPAITGIPQGTKEILIEYCKRQRPQLTQKDWIESRLDRDLKEERERGITKCLKQEA